MDVCIVTGCASSILTLTTPMNTPLVHTGTVHITIGSAGASLDSAKWLDMPWHVYGAYEFGFVRVSTTASTMLLQYVLNKDGSVADQVEIPSRF